MKANLYCFLIPEVNCSKCKKIKIKKTFFHFFPQAKLLLVKYYCTILCSLVCFFLKNEKYCSLKNKTLNVC